MAGQVTWIYSLLSLNLQIVINQTVLYLYVHDCQANDFILEIYKEMYIPAVDFLHA